MNDATRSQYWNDRYQENNAPWDLNQPAPAFASFLDSPQSPQPGETAVLGCGTGNDALFFAQRGFSVTGFDFAPLAIASAIERAQEMNVKADFLERDILTLGAEFPEKFDYLVEHTCFSAIVPEQRDRYVEIARSLLKPQGLLLGIFYTHSRPGGPPFGTTLEEIYTYFQPSFQILSLIPVKNSIPRRSGEEHFGILQRLSG